ncbi:hypothetical protein IFM46972_07761 [Aspergillus udagawae]|uniref:Uncharacterized protein n=1 Tax=Aspergillus udagawae TaxID=91492 RepID=A0A8H3P497_9EURO|nr:hypothetical protein IFM46972_07761 [Aspergillus udagawae]
MVPVSKRKRVTSSPRVAILAELERSGVEINHSLPQPRRRDPSPSRQGRRQVLLGCSPATLVPTQNKHQLLSLREKVMVNPVLCVRLAIQRGRLDVDVLFLARTVAVRPVNGDLMRTTSKNGAVIRYTLCPGLGNRPIIDMATKEPMAPESSLPGRPAGVGLKYLGM